MVLICFGVLFVGGVGALRGSVDRFVDQPTGTCSRTTSPMHRWYSMVHARVTHLLRRRLRELDAVDPLADEQPPGAEVLIHL